MTDLVLPANTQFTIANICVQNTYEKLSLIKLWFVRRFSVETVFRQGNALSPILFNIALESILWKEQKHSIGIKSEQKMVVAAYTNDLLIKCKTEDQVRSTEMKLMNDGRSIGLNINQDKIEYMILSRKQPQHN